MENSSHLLLREQDLWVNLKGTPQPFPTTAPFPLTPREQKLCRLAIDASEAELERMACKTIFAATHVLSEKVELHMSPKRGVIRSIVVIDALGQAKKTIQTKLSIASNETTYFLVVSVPSLDWTEVSGTFIKVVSKGVIPSSKGSYDEMERLWRRATITGNARDHRKYTEMVIYALSGLSYLPAEDGATTLSCQLLTRSAFF